MKQFANVISILFHPLLMTTYGMLLALNYTFLALHPVRLRLYELGGVILSTAVIPGLLIMLMVKSGAVTDLELSNRRERAVPYLIVLTSNMICLFYLFRLPLPAWLLMLFIGSCLAMFLALCINFVWKISVHALGIGGLLGAIMIVARLLMSNPYQLIIIVFLFSGLVATSRIILKKHTPMQVYAGFLLGFICTFGSSFYLFY